jgi:hypothetical protein
VLDDEWFMKRLDDCESPAILCLLTHLAS